MKVLAVNSSARVSKGSKTELILNHLAAGMRQVGAEVEVVNLKDKKIKACLGCFTCWTKTPGQCLQQDDMTRELLPKWLEADLCIYATPLYHHVVNAVMKTFIERTLPVIEPLVSVEGDQWRHSVRSRIPAAVILSVSGFPVMSAFDALTHYINYLFKEEESRLWAEIYLPGADFLEMAGERKDDILKAVESAGRELVESQTVLPETRARIEQPLVDNLADLAEFANCMWRTCIAEGETPEKLREKRIVPRPDSIKTFTMLLPFGFNPQGAGDTKAVIQFDFSGQVEGACHFAIADGTIRPAVGPADKADLIIRTPFELWLDIMTGKEDGGQMFMSGRFTAEGDMNLLINMSRFFGPSE